MIVMQEIKQILFVTLLFTSCINEDDSLINNQVEINSSNNFYKVSLAEADKYANDILDDLAGTTSTLSVKRKLVIAEYKVLSHKTRSSFSDLPDTVLYLLNYDKGFALLGADKRLARIYAISNEGELHFSDTTFNKPLAIVLNGINENIINTLIAANSPYSKPLRILPDGYEAKLVLYKKVDPILWPYVRTWSQDAPYNKYCFTADGVQAVAGCSPLAIAQIMSYYSWPQTIGNTYLPWRSMKKKGADDKIATLIRYLGNADLLNSQYGIKETVTKLNAQKRTFEALGYNCDEYTTYFDPYYAIQWLSGTLESNLNQRGPVLMYGLSSGKSTGHNWVIDGYLLNDIYTRRAGSTDESAWVKYAHDFELFHCVWGWGGKSNGYYCFSSKYAFSGKPIFTGVPDDNDRDIVCNYSAPL